MSFLIKIRPLVKITAAIAVCLSSFAALASVQAPSAWVLEPSLKNGQKQFHLIAEKVSVDIGDGEKREVIGYNGSTIGPVLVVNQGETFSVLITNMQRGWTSFGIHGLDAGPTASGLPNAGQKPIKNRETWEYKYTATAEGVYRYGPHFEHRSQEHQGLVGAVLVLSAESKSAQHVVLAVHDFKTRNGFSSTLLNAKKAPEVADISLKAGAAAYMHVLNLSPRPQYLHVPGMNIQRAGIAADTHTAPRSGATFTIKPRAGTWWLNFEDMLSKPLSGVSDPMGMPGMPGMPSSVAAAQTPRLSGLSSKIVVSGSANGQTKARLISSDANYGSPQRKAR